MRYVNTLPGLFLIVLAFQGNAQQIQDYPLSTRALKIVVIGSSTAAGTGANPPDSAWVNLYRDYLQGINPANEVINLAMGGYQTYNLMPSGFKPPRYRAHPDTLRNISKALSLRPDGIILNLPSNDAAAGFSLEEQLANFDTIAQTAAQANIPIWICTTQPRSFSADKILTQLVVRDSILQNFGDKAIDFWSGVAGPEGLIGLSFNSGDGIHLNNAGHRVLFESVQARNIPEVLYNQPEPTAVENAEAVGPQRRLLNRIARWVLAFVSGKK